MEKIIPKTIEDEMKTSYLDYAMSVIVGRALPDVRDGLKPVQRRILYTMAEMGLYHNQPFKKSARVVGEVLGKYHPHGDMAVYESMVRMAQDFTLRFPLIEGQGNFGSIDGDPPAAMRYTEVRLKDISKELLEDIEKNTVQFMPNYDGSLKEPTVLPSKLPNLLVNGSSGIAVGMATNIPPHNLTEVVKAIILRIDNPDATIDEIQTVLKGPDFPTGGIICGTEGIKNYLKTGKGTIKVRAKTEIENITPTKQAIIIKELPYQVNKSQLLERIAEVIKEGKIEDISNIRDESDKTGMRIVLELKRDAVPDIILNQLYLHTQLEETFGVIMLALVDGEPKILNILELIDHYINFRKDIIYKRTKYDLEKTESKAHILEGFKIVINEIDKVIKIIRESKDTQQATQQLIKNFKLSNEQASAILQLRLHQLTALEREKIEKEYLETIKNIEIYKSILEDPKKILNIIKQELTQLNEKYGDSRRTQIQEKYIETKHEDLIKEEDVIITISQTGYIKRTPLSLYKVQKRAEEPEIGASVKENDSIQHIAFSNTLFYLLFFTNKGKMYWIKTHEIPESSRLSTGTPLINFIPLETNEKVTSILPINSFEENEFIILVTKKGMIKKMPLIELLTARKSIQVIILNENDYIVSAKLTSGKNQIFIATKQGLALRFDEKQIRPTGRNSMGVTGIKLAETDEVIGCEIIESNKDIILTVTEKGYGKRTQIKEYSLHNRATKGQVNIIVSEKNGFVSGIVKLLPEEDTIIITSTGKAIRLKSDTIQLYGRNAQGVKLLTFKENDRVTSLTSIPL